MIDKGESNRPSVGGERVEGMPGAVLSARRQAEGATEAQNRDVSLYALRPPAGVCVPAIDRGHKRPTLMPPLPRSSRPIP